MLQHIWDTAGEHSFVIINRDCGMQKRKILKIDYIHSHTHTKRN